MPLLEWFDTIPAKARAKCRVRLRRLAEAGHALRRPEAGFLRDGVHELRVTHLRVRYRVLYFFHGAHRAVITHGFEKTRGRVPERELELAARRKAGFEADPKAHTFAERI